MKSLNWTYVGLLFTAGTLWGVAFLFVEIVIETIPPFSYVLFRNLLTAVVLVAALYWRGDKLPRFGRAWLPYFMVGFFDNAFPLMLTSNAQLVVDSGLVTIFVSTTPFFTLLLAWLFLRDEPITPNQILGILLGLSGIASLVGPTALQQLGSNLLSQLALLGASACYAIATVFSRSYLREQENGQQHSVLEWLTGQFVASTIMMFPIAFYMEDVMAIEPSGRSLIALFIAAWVIAIFAFLCFYKLNALAGPTYATFVTYLIPINGVLWGAVFLGEQVTTNSLVALGLILCGLAVVNNLIPLPRWLRSPAKN